MIPEGVRKHLTENLPELATALNSVKVCKFLKNNELEITWFK